jgi:nitrogen PTS system EIIA component
MDISNLISLDSIVTNLKATSKKQILQELGNIAKKIINVPSHEISHILLERERLGTTGVGHGVAIPHGRLSGLKQIRGIFAKLDKPVDYDAIDDQPVDLVFLLLAPEGAGADHLKALAKVSRMLRDKTVCDKLRGANNGDAIFAILTA